MEGFHYETTLDINTGSYTIRLLTTSKYNMEIVTEFGKFKYNCLPMGMCASGDILQDKVDKKLGNVKGFK